MSGSSVLAADPLTEAASYLIDRGFYGLVWLDPKLNVIERRGRLVDFVAEGMPVGLAILQLYGLDAQFEAVRTGQLPRIELTNIALIENADGPARRFNFYVHWMAEKSCFLLIMARATNHSQLEAELESQSRRAALAEAEVVEKALEIKKTNDELTRANRELSEFAYVISHDLKSPMRAMRYQVEDMEGALQRADAGTMKALVDEMKRQERRMSGMLTDLLAYARIGREEEAISPTDLGELIETIVTSLPRPAQFRIMIGGHWPVMEVAAPALDLVLRNLLDNAIKHHDRSDGRVEVTACSDKGGIEVTVSDDGPGIPRSFHSAVFQPFRKVPVEARPDGDGSGIGLALVRKAAEAAGAQMTLDSDPDRGRGTTFRLYWPGNVVA